MGARAVPCPVSEQSWHRAARAAWAQQSPSVQPREGTLPAAPSVASPLCPGGPQATPLFSLSQFYLTSRPSNFEAMCSLLTGGGPLFGVRTAILVCMKGCNLAMSIFVLLSWPEQSQRCPALSQAPSCGEGATFPRGREVRYRCGAPEAVEAPSHRFAAFFPTLSAIA